MFKVHVQLNLETCVHVSELSLSFPVINVSLEGIRVQFPTSKLLAIPKAELHGCALSKKENSIIYEVDLYFVCHSDALFC